jgi:hypothetical protein
MSKTLDFGSSVNFIELIKEFLLCGAFCILLFLILIINVVTHFWVLAQEERKYKKKINKKNRIKKINIYIYQKNITVKRGCQNAQKTVKIWFRSTKIIIW